jgi:hypothetical protein
MVSWYHESKPRGSSNFRPGSSDPAEPSLGSVGDVHFNQERWADGNGRDLKQDPAESGLGDYDGLLEQIGQGTGKPR